MAKANKTTPETQVAPMVATWLTPAQIAIAESLFSRTFSVTLGARTKGATPVSRIIPTGDFPRNVWEYAVAYGWQRVFNDKIGGADKSIADKVALVEQKIESFRIGNVTKARAAGMSERDSALLSVLKAIHKTDVSKEQYKADSAADDFDDTLFAAYEEMDDDATREQIESAVDRELERRAEDRARKAERDSAIAGLSLKIKVNESEDDEPGDE